MARIPDQELERLKREVSVQRLAEAKGIQLRRHGADLLGLCPFHDDREPSLVISPRRNLWHCLGACQAGGSVIDWVMKERGVSFRHAVELLRKDLPEAEEKASVAEPDLPPVVEIDAEDAEVLGQVVSYYHETLLESPEALEYLEKRGLQDGELAQRFELGFANRTLGYRLPPKTRKAGAEIRGRLQRLGVIRESGHEHFNGSLVVPIRDREGRVVELYGRKIGPRLREGTSLHLYLPGPHRGVWNLEGLAASKEVILCEAAFDAMTFWAHGFHHVTFAYGTRGFTRDHEEAFRAYGIRRVLVAYDRDEAGEKAARELADRLLAAGYEVYRVLFPKGMDANDYALHVSPPARSLDLVLRQASWMGNGRPPAERIPELQHPDVLAEQLEALREATKEEKDEEEEIPSLPLVAPATSSAEEPEADPPAPEAFPSETNPSVLPPGPPEDLPTTVREHEVVMRLGDRRYRVRGMARNLSYDVLKINLLAARGDAFHVDTLDLYAARQRAAFVKQAATELGMEERTLKHDLGRVILRLEELQDEQIQKTLEPEVKAVTLSDAERAEALELLRDPVLEHRILTDLEACGVVGEVTNKLVVYIAAVSRLLRKPLAVMVQSSSAAGKSALMEAVLSLVPDEKRVAFSAMTGQSLFYMGETDLSHKVLAVAEEEGAERASYALKLLQSEGKLSIASTGKDPQTGRLVTQEYHVEGPAAILTTTTSIDLDEELLNRCLVLTVDESREQTRAIHRFQREGETFEGLLRRQRRDAIRTLHQNAQRLLRPLGVVNPYAEQLTFPESCTRSRRDHEKYLTLIRSIALLRQYQRKVRTGRDAATGREVAYIEATLDDIALANELAHEVLGRTLDELPPQTRRLLELLYAMVREACEQLEMAQQDVRFSRRQVREHTGWGDTQLRVHLERLVELEYLLVHRGCRGQSYVYELLYDGGGAGGAVFLPGLIDARALGYDEKNAGSQPENAGAKKKNAGPSRPQRGGGAGGSRVGLEPATTGDSGENPAFSPKNASPGREEASASYRTDGSEADAGPEPVAELAVAGRGDEEGED